MTASIPCALGKLIPTAMDTEAIKTRGWREDGILVIALNDQRLTSMERAIVKQIGDSLYGRAHGFR